MEFHLSCLLIALISSLGVLAASTSSSSPGMFWSKTLPNTPMPKMIKDMLESNDAYIAEKSVHKKHRDPKLVLDGCSEHLVRYLYNYANTEEQVNQYKQKYGQTFMLKKDMTPGSTVKILWTPLTTAANTNSIDKITFLPRHVADSIPFSSDKLPDILNRLSINPKSEAAQVMRDTLGDCEIKDYSKGSEQKYCSTSLENMITFSTSKLGGNDVRALTSVTKVDKDVRVVGQTEFEIVGVKTEVEYGSPAVVCHRQPYPYAVFFCHKTRMTAAYTVSMVGGGMKVNALAVCHGDSSWWNPKTLALQMLKAKPGTTTPVCHFLEEGNLVWAKK
ncbi:hypothetical protein V2J09_023503 [Rumex salicifolius]